MKTAISGSLLIGIAYWVGSTALQLHETREIEEQEYKQSILRESEKIFSTPEERRENLVFTTKTPLVDSNFKPNLRLENAVTAAIQQLHD